MNDRKRVRVSELLIVCGSVALLITIIAVYMKMCEVPVVYQKPQRPVMPNPNAYDTYLRAAESLVDKEQVYDALYTKLDSPSLFNSYTPLPHGVPKASALTQPYSLAQKRVLIRINSKALSIFKEGLKQDFMLSGSIRDDFPKLSKIRNLPSLIALQAKVYRESNENGKAMMICLDGLEMGNDIARGAVLFECMISGSMQAIIRNEAWRTVDLLNSMETKQAIGRLESIISQSVPFKSMMIEQSYVTMDDSVRILNDEKWRGNLSSFDLPLGPQTMQESCYYISQYVKTFGASRRGLFVGLKSDYSQLIATTDLSYRNAMKQQTSSSNKLSNYLLPNILKVRFKYEYNRCMNDLLLLQLALHAYKLEHSRYPAKLDDLAPGYIKSVPTDRFAVNSEYKYKLTQKGYTLYSLGPDLKDDLGKPPAHPQNPKQWWVRIEDKGDIVAGFNK